MFALKLGVIDDICDVDVRPLKDRLDRNLPFNSGIASHRTHFPVTLACNELLRAIVTHDLLAEAAAPRVQGEVEANDAH